ncbi:MAG: L,D-transpeptidase family protein [Ignavibacterium sp.]|nr:L,D-transpeptidase family protein [Ignavibacterium sp.]
MILVLTDSITATKGNLVRFERSGDKNKWQQIEKMIPVVLGRNGLGWGKGLNEIDSAILPIKTEGDGRSPAGVFKLGAAFGYAGADKMKDLKIPYIPVSEMVECIDDIKSDYYNQIISRDKIKKVDWNTSEKMYFADIWYEQGIVVEQNTSPVVNGAGSCIFIHNWSKPDETSAGCTELEPARLTEIINWLDASANPVLVQLTKGLYELYQKTWQLPFPE